MKPNFPKQSSVYWFNADPSQGTELRKIRPCIVVSPDVMNKHTSTVIVVPLTSTLRDWPFRTNVTVLGQKSSAACDQIRAVDKKRLKGHIGDLRPRDCQKVYTLLQTILSE